MQALEREEPIHYPAHGARRLREDVRCSKFRRSCFQVSSDSRFSSGWSGAEYVEAELVMSGLIY